MEKKSYPILDSERIREGFNRQLVDDVYVFSTIDSTNDCCAQLYKKGARKNTLVIANQQLNGRGRMQRHFVSPRDGLYASLLYFPQNLGVEQLQFVTICAVLAVCEALEKHYDIKLDIKWLNDVYLHEKKIAGILAEAKIKEKSYEYVIIGIGINTYTAMLPNELQQKVSSIEDETGIIVDRNLIIVEMFASLFNYLQMIENNDYSFMLEYKKRNFLIGRQVQISIDNDEVFEVREINAHGHLVVENKNGQKILNAEEVKLYGW